MKYNYVVDARLNKTKVHEAITEPITIRVTKFNEDAAKAFSESMQKAHQSGQPIIPIVIDSFGGSVHSLLDMVSQIQSARLPVITIVEGKAMSCGAMLFAMGKDRYMAPYATLMLHDVSSFNSGKIEEIKSDAKETERLHNLVFSIVSKNVGKEKDYFTKILHEKGHAEWYLTAKDAKKHNLCTHIKVPQLVYEVSLNMRFE